MSSSDQSDERLSRMATHWSLVKEAHCKSNHVAAPARAELAERYLGAIYRYLMGAVRDVDVAEDICQMFIVKLLEGKLRGADPKKGRFRDYLKTALINLVHDHFRSRIRAPEPLLDNYAESAAVAELDDAEAPFLTVWREELIERTWAALLDERPTYHAILRLRIDFPDLTSRQLAQRYESQQGRPMSPASVRKTLERAHAKFADLLVKEVAYSLEHCELDDLKAEMETLDLLKYCGPALAKWKPGFP